MHSDVAVLKLKSNESESAKKIYTFMDSFFFYRSLNLVHLQLQLLAYTFHGRKKRLAVHKYFKVKISILLYYLTYLSTTTFLFRLLCGAVVTFGSDLVFASRFIYQ